MSFLQGIWKRLERSSNEPVLGEVRAEGIVTVTGGELLALAETARRALARAGFKPGDRCALLAHNSIRWAAADLAMMAEGVVVVPLYARQAPSELAAIVADAQPAAVLASDRALAQAIERERHEPPIRLLEELFSAPVEPAAVRAPLLREPSDPVTILYTSGTSGEAKGAVLARSNLDHMLPCTGARLDILTGGGGRTERVLHYLPFCFAGSWILLLTCLSRNALLLLSTDLTKLAEEIQQAAPEYFLNVPAVLERIRTRMDEQLVARGGIAERIYRNAKAAWLRRQDGAERGLDALWLGAARAALFPAIRRRLGPNLKALICGSAPLALETQVHFLMLGVPVLQVYGLTETTAICTLDDPAHVVPGRVGPAIPGIEMTLGENAEILVRGPNVFPGYWNRPEETARALRDGWFHTGDQGEVDATGNWRIIGRVKNLIILSSGHNVAPEPLEDRLVRLLPGAQQVMLAGNDRSYLAGIITGAVTPEQAETAIETLNRQLPHYQQIRAFRLIREPFSIENGLLTANGKLRRDAILARFGEAIEQLYHRRHDLPAQG